MNVWADFVSSVQTLASSFYEHSKESQVKVEECAACSYLRVLNCM